jgi:hypothetical protein
MSFDLLSLGGYSFVICSLTIVRGAAHCSVECQLCERLTRVIALKLVQPYL